MPSSISGSELSASGPGHADLRCALKITCAGMLLFGAVVLAYRGEVGFIEQLSNGALVGRMDNMVRYLPTIPANAGTNKTTLVFGTSMVQYGFSPSQYDRILSAQGIGSVSYNYGVANLNPPLQQLITGRIRETFQQQGFKLDLALIEFNPFQATAIRRINDGTTAEQNIAVLSSDRELWRQTLADPATGVRRFGIRYLRKGYSAELFSSLPELASQIRGPTNEEYRLAKQQVEAAQQRFGAILAKDHYPAATTLGWNPFNRGGQFDTSLLSAETLVAAAEASAALRQPALMQADLQRRIADSDILQLRFDEELFRGFLHMVEDFKSVSNRVEVILLPRNTEWVQYTPEVQARLDAMKLRITRETGVPVRDYQTSTPITANNFRDVTHLDLKGIEIFTQVLADDHAGLLAQ